MLFLVVEAFDLDLDLLELSLFVVSGSLEDVGHSGLLQTLFAVCGIDEIV